MALFEYISARGDVLNLTQNEFFTLTHIDSQTTAKAQLSSAVVGAFDGDQVNNARVTPRSIVIDLRLKDNIEDAKREILRFVKIKQRGTLKWTQNQRTVVIEGIVESIDMPRWKNGVTMQITLHCSVPYWENVDYAISEISEAISLHYFTDMLNDMLYFPIDGIPFGEYDLSRTKSFYNSGDVDVGMEIEITAYETVTNPIIYASNGDFFGVGYGTGNKVVTMSAGDKIVIKTGRNAKSVVMNGTTNLLSKVKPLSKWLQMKAGDNEFTVNSDDESVRNMIFTIKFKQRYV